MRLSLKISYSAVLSAISIIFMVLSHFIPFLTVSLLLIPAVCFYISFRQCGWLYGCITIGVSLFIAIAIDGFSPCASFLFAAIVFAPYSILAYILRPLKYYVPWQAAVRVVVCAVFFLGVTVGMLYLTELLLNLAAGGHAHDIRLLEGLETLIGRTNMAIAVLIIVTMLLPFDLFFTYLSEKIITRARLGGRKPPTEHSVPPPPPDPFE